MSEGHVYVFVRNDLTNAQKVVQACHAVLEMTREHISDKQRHSIVVIGAKNEKKLHSIATELTLHDIKWRWFVEPDMNNTVTAIATEPLTDKRELLKRFKLLEC